MPHVPTPAADRDALALLVIEDAQDDFELIVARLAGSFPGLRARRVDGRDALEAALRDGTWAAVLCDHRLPGGLSSGEALRLVRAHAPDVPFLIVSGAIGDEAAIAALHAGASDCVGKDDLGRLAPALSRALDAARAQARRRDAEAALVESEARFRSLAANLPGMVFQVEADAGRLTPVYASEGARRLFGLSPEELAQQPGAWLACLRPEDAAALRTRLLVATAGVAVTAEDRSPPGPYVHWIELVAQAPDRTGLGEGPRFLEITARGRRTSGARVLWDGIATDITRQKAVEAELRRSREELRELAAHLDRVREGERAVIARELHDDVGSTLTGAKYQLKALRGQAAADAGLAAKLAELDALVDAAITASTRIMRDLRPPILDAGIVAAIEWQARSFEQRTGIRCRFDASAETIDLAPAQATAVFRVCQEALNNVVKHALARSVEVALSASEGELALEIRDDGRGIAPGDLAKRGHFGLRGMQERALALDGTVAVRPRDDAAGTSVVLTFPLALGATPGSPA
ncbi:MAG: hypothetical protein BroJett026_21150 [Betaproteobacteria bacterium]|nr:MAG: hypothetical protein BroJett026_21150 [Betaproteobacteria bacterium]